MNDPISCCVVTEKNKKFSIIPFNADMQFDWRAKKQPIMSNQDKTASDSFFTAFHLKYIFPF